MSLKIQDISLNSWRSFSDYALELAPGLTILVGPNAAGKTNTIEAIQYLTAATSFRKPSPKELIQEGTEQAHIYAKLIGDGRNIDVEMITTPRSRKFLKNKKPCKPADFTRTLLSVLFCPDDLLLVKGSASKRRDELDDFGIQANKSYQTIYSTYTRSIEQRNHLLKDGCTGTLLDAWDESIALGAATLLQNRLRLFKKLSVLVSDIYQEITDKETLTCSYISTLSTPDIEPLSIGPDTYFIDCKKEDLTAYIEKKLHKNRAEDLRRGLTLLGPHRDDIQFQINGKDARTYGSQGQQRSIALAWKMAEVKFCEDILDSCPILLLDDVMSELDESRRRCITQFIKNDIQTVITTTNLGYFSELDLENCKVVLYD